MRIKIVHKFCGLSTCVVSWVIPSETLVCYLNYFSLHINVNGAGPELQTKV